MQDLSTAARRSIVGNELLSLNPFLKVCTSTCIVDSPRTVPPIRRFCPSDKHRAIMEHWLALAVIGYCIALAFVSEVVQYLFVYRTSAFKSLKANLEKHAKKVDEAKTTTAGKTLKKKQARLDTWRETAAKQVASIQQKMNLVSLVLSLLVGLKLLSTLFGGKVVAKLPFEPPGFLQKATHRGLTGAEVTDCSALFLYGLCQASLKPLVSKLLGWGPSRLMLEIKPTLPKQFEMFKQQ